MTTNQAAIRLLQLFSPEERSIPDAETYPGRNAAVIGAINGALQRLCTDSGPWVRKDSRAALIYAPTEITIVVVNGSTTTTILGWQPWMAGCLIVIAGDPADNQIKNDSATAILKIPYGGSTGSKKATVWCNIVSVASDVMEVAEPVRFNGSKITPLPANGIPSSLSTRNDYGMPTHLNISDSRQSISQYASTPLFYAVDTWTKDAKTPANLRITLSPVPIISGALEYETKLRPPLVDDLNDDAELPIPFGLADSVFLPIATMQLFDSPFFRGIATPEVITAKYQEAIKIMEKQNPRKQAPLFTFKG